MKKIKFPSLFLTVSLLSFGSQAFAKSCTVTYEHPSGSGTYIYSADTEWEAKAKFEKDHPGQKILNIVCK